MEDAAHNESGSTAKAVPVAVPEKTTSVPRTTATSIPWIVNHTNMKDNWRVKRQVGDPPPFDKLIVGGTLSLALLLLIGALAVGTMSWVDKSNYEGASLDDFVSLGEEACHIESTASYSVVEESLDRLNHLCKEKYEYNVRVVVDEDSPHNNETFVSTPFFSIACTTLCDICGPENFHGENHYVGILANEAGEVISPQTKVECWAPSGPAEDLSDYYECSSIDECYQLEDPSVELEDQMNSSQMGQIAALVGIVGSVILTCFGSYFVYRNRKALKDDEEILRQRALNGSTGENNEEEEAVA